MYIYSTLSTYINIYIHNTLEGISPYNHQPKLLNTPHMMPVTESWTELQS